MNQFRHATALIAIVAVLIVTAASAFPDHSHLCKSSRPCDICHSSHLPCLQPLAVVELSIPVPAVWQHSPSDFGFRLDTAWSIRAPRAPPV